MVQFISGALARLRAAVAGAGGERGEGVISAAIAVLIVAFLGAGMWLAFNNLFQKAAQKTDAQVECIGGSGCP